jgi:hypothetical protein
MEATELKTLPKFESEDDEREFWATHETSDYVDWSKATVVNGKEAFPNLKPTEELLVFSIPKDEVENFNSLAKKYHLTKDALASRFIVEGLRREQGRAHA